MEISGNILFVINKSPYPIFLPVLKLKHLKKLNANMGTFPTEEYAFLETALPNAECGANGGWELFMEFNDYYHFLGKGAGRVKIGSLQEKEKCKEFKRKYEEMRGRAMSVVMNHLK